MWVGQIYVNGKKKVKYDKTQKIVHDWLHEQKEGVNKGIFIDIKDIYLEAFLDRYMKSAAGSLRPKTVNSYLYLIKNHIIPELSNVKLTQLRPDMLQAFYTKKLNGGLSKRTVQYIHAVLHKSLNHALRWNLVVKNVSDLVDSPSPTGSTTRG